MVLRNSLGSTPSAFARVNDCPVAVVRLAIQALQASFSEEAAPIVSPTSTVLLPIASNTGRALAIASAEPDARTIKVPASAGPFVPTTGASTTSTFNGSASAAMRRIPAGPTVADCSQMAPAFACGRKSRAAAVTASSSKDIVIMTSASATASAAVPATMAPSEPRAAALLEVRFQTVTSKPSRSRVRAIPAPIVPVPRTATCISTPLMIKTRGAVTGLRAVECARSGPVASELREKPKPVYELHKLGRSPAFTSRVTPMTYTWRVPTSITKNTYSGRRVTAPTRRSVLPGPTRPGRYYEPADFCPVSPPCSAGRRRGGNYSTTNTRADLPG